MGFTIRIAEIGGGDVLPLFPLHTFVEGGEEDVNGDTD
jgi:hypothetical protein